MEQQPQTLRMKNQKRLNKTQADWVDMCKQTIGDPIGLDKFISGESTDFYNDVILKTCRWWEMHSSDILHKLQDFPSN